MIRANFTDGYSTATAHGLYQWDYGQILEIHGLSLPPAVEVHFAMEKSIRDAKIRIGNTVDKVTKVAIPEYILEQSGDAVAYIYISDTTSGKTVKKINMPIIARQKPEAFDAPEDAQLFREAIEAVNAAADRAELFAEQSGNSADTAEQAKNLVMQIGREVTENKEYVDKKIDDFNVLHQQAVQNIDNAGNNQVESINSAGQKAIENIGTGIDPTFTQEGKAADAKATGDKLTELKGDLDEFGVQLSDLVGVEGNLIDKSSVVDDSYIDAEGNVEKASGYFCTDYIPVLENKSYYWASLYKGYYAFYDSNKKFIDGAKGSSNLTNPFTTPIGTAYARFTALNQEAMANAWIYEENRRPSDYKKVVKMPLKSESIGEYNLIDSSVTESKIANNSVSEAKIADKCIGAEKIKNYSVEPKVTTFIVHDDETDFIDGWVKDKYVNAQGQLTNYEGFYATEPIHLSENTTYYWDRFRNGYYAFYDAEGNVIESHGDDGSLTKPFVTPTGTVFARFTAIREDQTRYSWISTQNKKPDKYGYMLDKSIKVKSEEFDNSYCNYNGNEVCMFTKGLCIGDSLTEGTFNYYLDGSIAHYKNISKYSYPSIFQRLTGIPMTNKGHGGMTSIQWYEAEKDNTFSGYDFAIIQLGVNDAIQIGSWTQEVETAFRNIITKLKSENKGIKIFVSTITPAIDYSGEQFDRITTGIRSFVPSLNDDNVILLDMAIYSSLGDTKAYNCGHYTAYGYWRLAQDYKNYIGYVMNTNKLAFRNVQFINTDYEVNP